MSTNHTVINGPVPTKPPLGKRLLRLAGKTAFVTTIGALTLTLWSLVLGSLFVGSLLGAMNGSQASPDTADDLGVTQDTTAPDSDDQAIGAPTSAAEPEPVILEVTTNTPAEVRWNDADTNNAVPEPVNGTWTQELETDPGGFNYYSVDVSESEGNAGAELSCRILVGDKEIDANSAAGEYAGVTCSST